MIFPRMKLSLTKGFTLFEMLVAMTVASILSTATLNVYTMFHRGVVETVVHYGQFSLERIKELRCRTRFVRGLPPCDTTLGESRAFRASCECSDIQTIRASHESRDAIRARFSK